MAKSLRFLCGAGGIALLSACSPYVGVGIPVGPVTVGVGLGSGGVSAGVGTGVGPVGVGVGVNQSGQVTGNAGVGVGTSVGNARVGAGVGTGTVLYDPAQAPSAEPLPPSAPPQPAPAGSIQWHDAQGQPVPDCKLENRC
ncbi:MAG: hypothetical protein ACN6O3_04640 [Comamonas sp.]